MSQGLPDLQAGGLSRIAQGITLVLDELRELGMAGAAGAGRGFEDIALTGLQLGHGGLTADFKAFCERWEWGVRSLVNEGNDFARGVGLSAGTFHETEKYVEGSLKIAVNAVNPGGSPYASEEEVTRKNWGELTERPFSDADYSLGSVMDAKDNAVQGWKDAGRDAATSPLLGPVPQQVTGMSDEEYEAKLDETFGPSPDERAADAAGRQNQTRQQGGGTD
ncbi:hypothetical protein [Streptomyces aureocirculatus]|uniref:hypothetical protein n=1 Tax=Streptomyces aureocirculatus TaxID=67275 RepID=UPI00068D5226|nr:hypothetical protein [Streptomyces aureocirculatus]